jgi:dihydropteroate synthase
MSAFADPQSPVEPASLERILARPSARRGVVPAARIMGILNVTPDSFSDGGRFTNLDAAIDAARRMLAEGATIIDVGGESTRPGAEPVSVGEELERVIPVIEAVAQELSAAVSVDTSKPKVMEAAVRAGATMINDVMALRAEGAIETARDLGVPVCLMHMQGQPRTMQKNPHYDDVVAEVREFLLRRVDACSAAGIDAARLLIDPGFGFGKTLEHNLTLLADLDVLVQTGYPVLVGLSRKSMIAAIMDRPVDDRTAASAALALIAVQKGAAVVRVHDVAETNDALSVSAWVARAERSRGTR